MEAALNQTAERLGQNFAEIESGRHELAPCSTPCRKPSSPSRRGPGALVQRRHAAHCRHADPRRAPAGPLRARPRAAGLRARRARTPRGCVTAAPACWLRAASLRSMPRHLPSGGALVVLHDVTSIEAAQKSRRDFVANVSHELRTPLTSIQGYVETLIEDPNPSPETTARVSRRHSEKRQPHEPPHRGSARAGQRRKSRLQARICSPSAPACWCRTRSSRWAASSSTPASSCSPPARPTPW